MLGLRIAFFRKQAGLSQAELGLRLGLSPSAVSSYEQGRREPSADILVAMAKEFGVTTDYLVTGSENAASEPIQPEVLLCTGDGRTFNALNPGNVLSYNEIAVLFAALLANER